MLHNRRYYGSRWSFLAQKGEIRRKIIFLPLRVSRVALRTHYAAPNECPITRNVALKTNKPCVNSVLLCVTFTSENSFDCENRFCVRRTHALEITEAHKGHPFPSNLTTYYTKSLI